MTYTSLHLIFNPKKTYIIKKNTNYVICRENTVFYTTLVFNDIYQHGFYLINGQTDKEFCIFIRSEFDLIYTIPEILTNIQTYQSQPIGENMTIINEDELNGLYYILGTAHLSLDDFGIKHLYDTYINILYTCPSYFNPLYLKYIYYYHLGYYKNNYSNAFIDSFIKKNEKFIITKKCLVVSKLINGYGGNQKTSRQLIELLEQSYIVSVLSVHISNERSFSFKINILCNSIHPNKIIKLNARSDIITHINQVDYSLIINNKMNEFCELLPKLNKKIDVITHNTMDPFNRLIIDYERYINRVFTINKIHVDLFKRNGVNCPIYQYTNYVDENIKIPDITDFNYTIVFIGRLSKEKNLLLLYDAIQEVNRTLHVELIVIGDGDMIYMDPRDNITFMGYQNNIQIFNILQTCDYLMIPSYTEGIPFTVLEAMSIGIPCIGSNTNGINEIIQSNNGFLFNLKGYEQCKYNIDNWDVYDNVDSNFEINLDNLVQTILNAYRIPISQWNQLSMQCYLTIHNTYLKSPAFHMNNQLLTPMHNIKVTDTTPMKVFINFKPVPDKAYGGGNISTYYIQTYLHSNNFIVYHELQPDIDVFLIIDPLKNIHAYKKYGLADVVQYRNSYATNGKIILRVNDCDKTRPNTAYSREKLIITYLKHIDLFIFNSQFIKEYYLSKCNCNIQNTVIYNGCDLSLFVPTRNIYSQDTPLSIVTHHWSSNEYKGYQTYLDLYDYCNVSEQYKFKFIGNKVPDFFSHVPISGPFSGTELVKQLNIHHVYVTDSKYDSCPNHVLEAIACGLPILYTTSTGGGKNLCEIPPHDERIGESFIHFEELIHKLDLIRNNYDFYKTNVMKYRSYYCHTRSCKKYIYEFQLLKQSMYKPADSLPNDTNIHHIHIKEPIQIIFKTKDKTHLLNTSLYKEVSIISKTGTSVTCQNQVSVKPMGTHQQNNSSVVNFLYCCDEAYFVGMFASLRSLLINSSEHSLSKCHFNFIIPLHSHEIFNTLMTKFVSICCHFTKTVVFLDNNIIDERIIESKCYNGGNHLLNIGNLSRLLIGELFQYQILMYLDSDSIIQEDLYEKIKNIDSTCPYYGLRANVVGDTIKQNICLKLSSIINTDFNWNSIIQSNIDGNEWAYMGAPFIANCQLWNDVYSTLITIVQKHNETEGGLYSIFTMSLQNIIFYQRARDISPYVKCICDCGSVRKIWSEDDLQADVLDWSGNLKPWFTNGLYREKWLTHDIMNLSLFMTNAEDQKHNTIETFQVQL